jgi:hypothetical protein
MSLKVKKDETAKKEQTSPRRDKSPRLGASMTLRSSVRSFLSLFFQKKNRALAFMNPLFRTMCGREKGASASPLSLQSWKVGFFDIATKTKEEKEKEKIEREGKRGFRLE